MQTAIQELINKLPFEFILNNSMILIDALKKEKEQIIDAYENASSHGISVVENGIDYIHGEEYYNQTYNQNKS